jgi:hypothetical protein
MTTQELGDLPGRAGSMIEARTRDSRELARENA